MPTYQFFTPLVSPLQSWAGFAWQSAGGSDETAGQASCVASCAACIELAAAAAPLAERQPVFLPQLAPEELAPATRASLEKVIGKARLIPLLGEAAVDDAALVGAWRQLSGRLAIRVGSAAGLDKLTPDRCDYALLDLATASGGLPLLSLVSARERGVALVGENAGTHALFDWACKKRFALSGGEFIGRGDLPGSASADTARLKLLKLLSLVIQDASTRDIEEIFRQEPKLSYNLLRLVNSAAVAPKTPITSFNQAINVLGRRQLQRWLQLLIYANHFSADSRPNALMQLAAMRGRLMEELAATLPGSSEALQDAAFLAGSFSLLDTLLNLPMRDILATLPLAEEITAALGERRGALGERLAAVVASDSGRFAEAATRLGALGIAAAPYFAAQLAACTWACGIGGE